MKEASKLKREEEVYSPSSKPVSRARIFQSLCDDPEYPCRDCTLVPNTMTCVNNSCAAWRYGTSVFGEGYAKDIKQNDPCRNFSNINIQEAYLKEKT